MLDSDLLTSPLEQVLLDLGAQGSTGCLYATDVSGEEAEVYLRDGSVYSVFVPGRRPLLGARLMSSGSLAPETLAEALEIQRTELQGWRLGELLVYLGFVDRDVVESFVSEQLVDMLTDLMRWDIATSKFRKNKKARQDVAPPQPVDALLAELRRRRGRWDELSEALGGPDTVPMLSAQGGAADDVVLGPGEWAMLCKVDGERSIADLAADCGYTLYEAAQVVHSLVEAGLVDLARDASALEALPGAGDDGEWVVDDEPSDAELADSVERVRRALASMLEPDSTSAAAGTEPGTAAATAGPVANGRASDRSQSRSLAELVAEAEAAEAAEAAEEAEAAAASDVPELPARKSHLRVVEDDGQRRRREADEIAAEVEAARLKELGRIETDRRNKSDAVRQAVEDEAWGEHRLWLVMEQSAAEAEAWRFHRLWLAEQRAGDEDEAWQAHEQWMAAERARAEIRAWDEYARRLAAEVAAAEVEAWAEQAARMAAERVAAEAEAWAEQAARIAAERTAAEEPAWADHAAWLEAERAAAELAAWADHEARLAAEEAARLAVEEAARLAAEEEAVRLAAEEAARLAEEEAVRLAAEEAARLAEEEAARVAAEEEAARLAGEEAARIASEEEAARLAGEEAARVAAEAEAARLAAEEAAYYAAQEAANAAAQEAARFAADEEARRVAEQVEAARVAAEQAALHAAAEAEAARLAAEAEAEAEEQARRAQSDSELATVGASHDTHDAASVAYMLTQINAEASTAVAQAIRTQEAQAPAPVEDAPPPVIDSAGANRGQTDTAALLRELSGLFASGSEDSKPAGTSPPAAPAAPRQAPKDDGKKKKRGLFGR